MSFQPTIHLDLRLQSARQMFSVGLGEFTDAELKFMAETFARADQGVEFNVGQTDDGRQCMQFVIGQIKEASDAQG